MTTRPPQPADKQGSPNVLAKNPSSSGMSGKGAGKSSTDAQAKSPTQAGGAAATETLRLIGKIEQHVGELRTAIEAPTQGAPNAGSDRSSQRSNLRS